MRDPNKLMIKTLQITIVLFVELRKKKINYNNWQTFYRRRSNVFIVHMFVSLEMIFMLFCIFICKKFKLQTQNLLELTSQLK